jgi:hypothetical protein
LKLAEARDTAQREQEEAKASADRKLRAALDVRDSRHRAVSERAQDVQKGLIELIEALDHDPDRDKAHRLAEAATASPETFSEALRELL